MVEGMEAAVLQICPFSKNRRARSSRLRRRTQKCYPRKSAQSAYCPYIACMMRFIFKNTLHTPPNIQCWRRRHRQCIFINGLAPLSRTYSKQSRSVPIRAGTRRFSGRLLRVHAVLPFFSARRHGARPKSEPKPRPYSDHRGYVSDHYCRQLSYFYDTSL